jgi:hypothetical protein
MFDQVKQDLQWLANSPALVAENALGFPAVGHLDEVNPSDVDLARALEARQAERLRLGIYFEDLVELSLRCRPGVSDVRRGIAIRENKRTLGELDFLFRNERGQQEHWEVAVKFYLYHREQDPNPDLCFLGPRTVDRMDRKVHRMRDHQLPLPMTPPAMECLGLGGPSQSKALVRGRLFYPLEMDWRECHVDTISAPDHLRGWWTPLSSLAQIPSAEHYLVVRKCDWLTCPPASPHHRLHTLDSLRLQLSIGRLRPVQVIGVDADHRELHRGFVVPDHWPQAAER